NLLRSMRCSESTDSMARMSRSLKARSTILMSSTMSSSFTGMRGASYPSEPSSKPETDPPGSCAPVGYRGESYTPPVAVATCTAEPSHAASTQMVCVERSPSSYGWKERPPSWDRYTPLSWIATKTNWSLTGSTATDSAHCG